MIAIGNNSLSAILLGAVFCLVFAGGVRPYLIRKGLSFRELLSLHPRFGDGEVMRIRTNCGPVTVVTRGAAVPVPRPRAR